MTPSQRAMLTLRRDVVIDVAISHSDPSTWTGGTDAVLDDLSKQDRGDRAWCIDIATKVVGLATRMQLLLNQDVIEPANDMDSMKLEDRRIAEAEAEVVRLMDRSGKPRATH